MSRARNAQIRHRHKDVVRRADHDDVASLQAQALQAEAQPPNPLQQLVWREVLLRVLGIDPDGLVGEQRAVAKDVSQDIALGDVDVLVYGLERHCGCGWRGFPFLGWGGVTQKDKMR